MSWYESECSIQEWSLRIYIIITLNPNMKRSIILICTILLSALHPVRCYTFQVSKKGDLRKRSLSTFMFFDFNDDPIHIPQQDYDNLVQSILPSAPIKIQKSNIGHGYGLFCTKDVDSDSTLFTIPSGQCITLDDVRSHPDLGKVLTIMQEEAAEDEGRIFGNIASLSAYLASEWLREQCAEWEEDTLLASKHGPYLKILPSGRGVSEQDHILWWKAEEVQNIFKRGAAFDKAESLREWVEAESHIIEGMLVSDLAQKGMGLSISQVRRTINNAFVNVLNRGLYFEENGDKLQRLCPVLDMCVHSVNPNLKGYIDKNGDVVVNTLQPLRSGEELSLRYYSNEFEGHEFYVMFGFVANNQ